MVSPPTCVDSLRHTAEKLHARFRMDGEKELYGFNSTPLPKSCNGIFWGWFDAARKQLEGARTRCGRENDAGSTALTPKSCMQLFGGKEPRTTANGSHTRKGHPAGEKELSEILHQNHNLPPTRVDPPFFAEIDPFKSLVELL